MARHWILMALVFLAFGPTLLVPGGLRIPHPVRAQASTTISVLDGVNGW